MRNSSEIALEVTGKKVLVVGLAKSGVASAKVALQKGAHVTVTDRRAATELAAPLRELEGAQIAYALGGHDERDFTSA